MPFVNLFLSFYVFGLSNSSKRLKIRGVKVSILGATGPLCQIPELRKGFAELGHEHVDDPRDPDVAFVFIGNPPYDGYLDLIGEKKTIFNVLDICYHCREVNDIITSYRTHLPKANRVTCISKAVQTDLKDICGIDSEVIYYPSKPVKYTGEKKYSYKALMVGRLRDPNKHTSVGIQALIRAGFTEADVAMVGPEYPGWGVNMGNVTDSVLNDLYNSVDYVYCGSKTAGIELPPIEAALCGVIPIVLPHLQTFDEFWAESFLGMNYRALTSPHKVAELILSLEKDPAWKANVKQDMLGYAELKLRPKVDRVEVAKRVLEVYHTI